MCKEQKERLLGYINGIRVMGLARIDSIRQKLEKQERDDNVVALLDGLQPDLMANLSDCEDCLQR